MNNVAGFFLYIGGREIAYGDIALLAASVAAICYLLPHGKIDRKQILVSLLLVGAACLGVLHTMLRIPETRIIGFHSSWDRYLFGLVGKTEARITMQTLLMLARLLLFLLNSYIVFRFDREELYRAANYCKTFTKLHILFAAAEILTKYLLRWNVMTELRDFLFGAGMSTYSSLQLRGGGVAIFGWTREASHMPEVMFLFVVLCVLTGDVKRQKGWLILAGVIMVMSMAFSALLYIGCIAVLMLCVYARRLNRKTVLALCIGGLSFAMVCCILASNDYYAARLEGFFRDAAQIFAGKSSFSAGVVTSAKVRLLGIVETWKAFLERPLFGLGLGTAYCHSGLVSLLSNLGLVGTGLWIDYCANCGFRCGGRKQTYLLFGVILLLPNIMEGKLSMLYAAHNLLVIQLMKAYADFEMNENQVANYEILSYYHRI